LRRRLASLPDDVEDLLQELLLAIHIQRHTYDSTQPLTPWVQAIARYKLGGGGEIQWRPHGYHLSVRAGCGC
jgi:hypothetical protein